MKRVGLFFGSFNPIHIGHLIIASYVADNTDLDQIWFVVSPHNPLKEKKTLLADHHRMAMVRRAVENDARFRASDIEFNLPQPSYTTITLAHLKEKHPDINFTLLMGGDNLASLPKWKNYQTILDSYPIIVYSRPNNDVSEMVGKGDIRVLDAPQMNISSSTIRKFVTEKKETKYMMPPEAWQYMDEMNFYR